MKLGNPIARGNTAIIYVWENKFVKVFKDTLPETEALNEANKQRYAFSCGLPVPEIIDVTKINGKQAIIMEYVKGETLGDLLFKDKVHAEYYINLSVKKQLEIHRIIPNVIEGMFDRLYRQIKTVKKLDDRQKKIEVANDNSFIFGYIRGAYKHISGL
ncbi:hypothetical protein LCL95_01560 [Bacillus timonensis]|nr:hypothetical protein [Bacillus timonensis]